MIPDKQYLEITFDFIKPIASSVVDNKVCFLPVIIFGNAQEVIEVQEELLKFELNNDLYIMIFAPLLCDYGYITQKMMIDFIRSLNTKLCPIILAHEIHIEKLNYYEDFLNPTANENDVLFHPKNIKVNSKYKQVKEFNDI